MAQRILREINQNNEPQRPVKFQNEMDQKDVKGEVWLFRAAKGGVDASR